MDAAGTPSAAHSFDVAIVGGGPVGLAAAIEARLAGLSVVLIEQRGGAIDKACGEGLMPGAVPLLHRLGVDVEGLPLRGITYRSAVPGSPGVTHRFAGAAGRGVRRTTLHRALALRVEQLGVLRVEGKATQLRQGVAGVQVSVADRWISARYLLGCDGLHSTVASLTGLRAVPATGNSGLSRRRRRRALGSRRYGVRQHYAVAPWSDNVEVYWADDAEFYVTPVSPAVIGLAMLSRQGIDFDTALASVPELAARLAGAEPASSRRGAGPFGQATRARTAGRVLLVGDASGYVDAITGEGLRLGMAQARVAVQCIAAQHPGQYEKQWRSETRDFRLLTTSLVAFATSRWRGRIVPLAVRLPWLFGIVVERLAR